VPEVRRAGDRFCTRTSWLTSWHSFSYGPWYDAGNVGFGPLVASNHDVLAPGAGFDEHSHSGVDLVTYVVSGALEHRDSMGNVGVFGAGDVQLLRSGSGVRHSERNASATQPVEYVQMWLTSDNVEPSYGIPAVGGDPSPDLLVALRWATLRRFGLHRRSERAGTGGTRRTHAYVLSGAVRAGDVTLLAGDALRLTDEQLHLAGTGKRAQLLVWSWAEPQSYADQRSLPGVGTPS
jgi:redox-sensitive bicupin YhaK (pirin superfamily)